MGLVAAWSRFAGLPSGNTSFTPLLRRLQAGVHIRPIVELRTVKSSRADLEGTGGRPHGPLGVRRVRRMRSYDGRGTTETGRSARDPTRGGRRKIRGARPQRNTVTVADGTTMSLDRRHKRWRKCTTVFFPRPVPLHLSTLTCSGD